MVKGWVWDAGEPDARQVVEVLVNGTRVTTGVADVFRPDLLQDNIGDGRHAFRIDLPEPISWEVDKVVCRVERTGWSVPTPPWLRHDEE